MTDQTSEPCAVGCKEPCAPDCECWQPQPETSEILLPHEVAAMLREGNRVQAIKQLRLTRRLPLVEAMKLAQAWEEQERLRTAEPEMEPDQREHIIAASLDHPSAYMGGPSQQSRRKARRIIEALEAGGYTVSKEAADVR